MAAAAYESKVSLDYVTNKKITQIESHVEKLLKPQETDGGESAVCLPT